jgi:DMSO/TMAO reductase YedYZ heme-binding membrane subunit
MSEPVQRQPAPQSAPPRADRTAAASAPRQRPPDPIPDDYETFWGAIFGALVGLSLAVAGLAIGLGLTGWTGDTHSYWYLSRASGFVAYLLLWGSVAWGLLLSSKIGKGWLRPPALLDAHQFLSNVAVGFTLFHGLILMGDHYLSFPLQAILLPFAGDYKPALVAAGQLGLWLSVLLVISFYVRKRLGQRLWRTIHYSSFLAYWVVLLHSVLIGTDSKLLGVQFLYLATGSAVFFLTVYRILARDSQPRKASVMG